MNTTTKTITVKAKVMNLKEEAHANRQAIRKAIGKSNRTAQADTTGKQSEEREIKINPRREELKALSAELMRQATALGMEERTNDLLKMHSHDKGYKELKTFDQWKAEGYTVRKGERSLMIWSRPIDKVKSIYEHGNEVETPTTEENSPRLFGICHLFDITQVHKDKTPQGTN